MKMIKQQCQNCKIEFEITDDDLGFYSKIKVPPPTFCPDCRLQRRLTWRNERSLYRIKCNLCGKNTLSIYKPNYGLNIYCQDCWWSDGWDPLSFGVEYDFSKPFWEQYKLLLQKTPLCSLFNISYVNSDFCNYTYQSKNCYLNFASDMNEDTAYLYHSIENRNCYEMLGCRKNENCFNLSDCEGCYGCIDMIISEGCINTKFCYDCHNCQDCLGCAGLRSARYCIFNEKYSKENYEKEILKYNLGTENDRNNFKEKFKEFILKYPRKYINARHMVNCTGDYIKDSQNCFNCFDIEGPNKDMKYCIYGVTNTQNTEDAYGFGVNVENCYDILGAGDNVQNILLSMYTFSGSFNCTYGLLNNGSSNIFGCVSLKNKSYCILNKQYTKESFDELRTKIIKHMNDMPYIDSKGRVYKYGEFFPPELSPFCYNETIAQEHFPLTKEQALNQGYKWKEKEERNYNIDIKNNDIPDDIKDTDESIINKVIECNHKDCNEQCTEAFKIIPEEYQFYKRMNLPLPRLCPNCRHYQRLKQRNPMKLWHRHCMKEGCPNEFETSYSPDRPEIVYCEQCYQREVY